MTYARARLWLGITTVGSLVLLAITAWAFSWPEQFLPTTPAPWTVEAASIAGTVLAWALVIAPFDALGGFLLPRRFGRVSQPFSAWFVGWLRGVVTQSSVSIVALFVLLQVGQSFGFVAAFACVSVLQVALIGLQEVTAGIAGGLAARDGDSSATEIQHRDPGFTGGITGLPGRERILLPGHWDRSLSPSARDAEIVRRRIAIASGRRTLGLVAAIAWNTAGFGLALFLPGANVSTVAGLTNALLGFCLFQFVGLLLLPATSRAAAFEVDRLALASGVPIDDLEMLFRETDAVQDGEPKRSPELESVFHPLPCVERRLAALRDPPEAVPALWNLARTALFLSWPCGGPLARAVHCNVGRPELWVLLPY